MTLLFALTIFVFLTAPIAQASSLNNDEDCDYFVVYSHYNAKLQKCVLPIGSKCVDLQQMDKFVCAENSICSPQGKCACAEGYRAINKSGCSLAKTWHEPCGPDAECDTEFGKLFCDARTCKCRHGEIWNNSSRICIQEECQYRSSGAVKDQFGKCLLKIGEALGPNSTVLQPQKYFTQQILNCPVNSTLVTTSDEGASCACKSGFESATDGRNCIVKKRYREMCSTEGENCDSNAGLTCQNRRCRCTDGATWSTRDSLCYSTEHCQRRKRGTFYNEKRGCVNKIGSTCAPFLIKSRRIPVPICPDNSICTNVIPGHLLGISSPDFIYKDYSACVCRPGYIETSNKESCVVNPFTFKKSNDAYLFPN